MAKKTATPTTVTLKHLAAAIADEQELSKKQAEAILNDLVTRQSAAAQSSQSDCSDKSCEPAEMSCRHVCASKY